MYLLKSKYYTPFLLFLAIIFSYSNSLNGIFVFDDLINFVQNKTLHLNTLNIDGLKEIATSPTVICKSRFLANLSLAINYYIDDLNPIGYHIFNISIHFISSLLFYYLLIFYLSKTKLSKPYVLILSLFAALLWATNPMQTNVVTYIVQRMTSMSAMFMLASLLCHIKIRTKKYNIFSKFQLISIGIISFACAMLSKEIAIILPVLILCNELYFFSKPGQQNTTIFAITATIVPIALCVVIYFLGTNPINHILEGYTNRNFSLYERLLTQTRVVFHYISLFLYPIPSRLSIYYDTWPISQGLFSPLTTFFSIFGLTSWITLIIITFKKHRLFSFGLLWMFLTLILESSFIALELVFEHRFYFSSIGLILCIFYLISVLITDHKYYSKIIYFSLIIIITLQIGMTYSRNFDFSSELIFEVDATKKNISSPRAHTNLAVTLVKQNNMPGAVREYKVALLINPNYAPAIANLTNLFLKTKNPEYLTFIKQLKQLILKKEYKHDANAALYLLANTLYTQRKYNESLFFLLTMLEHNHRSDVYQNIANCYFALKEYSKAETAVNKSLQLDPTNGYVQYLKALVLTETFRIDEAKEILHSIDMNQIHDLEKMSNIELLKQRLDAKTTN